MVSIESVLCASTPFELLQYAYLYTTDDPAARDSDAQLSID